MQMYTCWLDTWDYKNKEKKSPGVYLSSLENAFAYQLTEFIIS